MSFQDVMATLKKEYVASIPEKIAEIRGLSKSKNYPALRDAFHKLKGSGQTYGLPDISQIATPVESLFKKGSSDAMPACERALILFERIYKAETQQLPFQLIEQPEFLTLMSKAGKLAA